MKNILVIVGLVLVSITSQSQNLCVWQGGAPGREKDWNCSRNWVNGSVPTKNSDVYIPELLTTKDFLPVIAMNLECRLIRLEYRNHIIDIIPNQNVAFYRDLEMKLYSIASNSP